METGKLEHRNSAVSQVAHLRRGFQLLFIIVLVLLSLPLLMEHYDRLVFTPKVHPLPGSAIHYSKHLETVPVRSNHLRNHTPKTSTALRLAGSKFRHHGTNSSHPTSLPMDSKSRSSQGEHFGYILTFQYSGQQGAGINALISQQCWVESFRLPMLLVEPFIWNSSLGAHPESPNTTLKFSDYYDMELYSKASIAEGYGRLATWEEFLDQAPRQIIVVAINRSRDKQSSDRANTHILWERKRGTDDCYVYRDTDSSPARKLLSLQSNYSFCAVKVVHCAYSFGSPDTFTAAEMQRVIFGSWDPRQVTLVFTIWRGPWFVPNPSLPNPDACRQYFSKSSLADNLYSSPQLIEMAQKYERQYLHSKCTVAVMLRTEHVIDALRPLLRQPNTNVAVKYNHYLRDVLTKTNRLRKRGDVFVTVDVGKYGSNTWGIPMFREILSQIGKEHVFQAVQDTVTRLFGNRLTFEEWENTFSNVTSGVEDRGYIAGLQKATASRADCLVLVGGGHFQHLALREYIHNHPDQSTWCVEVLCAVGSSTKQYQELLMNKRNKNNGKNHIHTSFVPR